MQIDHTILMILQGVSMKVTLKFQGFQNNGEQEVKNGWLKKMTHLYLTAKFEKFYQNVNP